MRRQYARATARSSIPVAQYGREFLQSGGILDGGRHRCRASEQADGCAAWNALTPERQAQLAGLKLHHSYQHFMATRQYNQMDLPDEIRRANPDVVHPLIRTHPANGRKALWPSTGTVTEVIGVSQIGSVGHRECHISCET